MSRWKTSAGAVVRRAIMTITLLIVAAVGVSAQTPAPGFVTGTEIQRESLPALPLLYTAYAFVWVALIVYVFVLWRRIEKVERELADVRGRIAQRRS